MVYNVTNHARVLFVSIIAVIVTTELAKAATLDSTDHIAVLSAPTV